MTNETRTRESSTTPTERPPCKCHGMPSWWHGDKRSKAGGYWRCSVRESERNARRVGFVVLGMDMRCRVKAGPHSAREVARIRAMCNEFSAEVMAKQAAQHRAERERDTFEISERRRAALAGEITLAELEARHAGIETRIASLRP